MFPSGAGGVSPLSHPLLQLRQSSLFAAVAAAPPVGEGGDHDGVVAARGAGGPPGRVVAAFGSCVEPMGAAPGQQLVVLAPHAGGFPLSGNDRPPLPLQLVELPARKEVAPRVGVIAGAVAGLREVVEQPGRQGLLWPLCPVGGQALAAPLFSFRAGEADVEGGVFEVVEQAFDAVALRVVGVLVEVEEVGKAGFVEVAHP